MKVTLDRLNDNYHFEARGASNVPVFIDSKTDEGVKGASPVELLLMAVGGCNAIDVVMILKKQRQQISSYRVEVEGKRKEVEQAKPFESMHVTIYLEGDIKPEKALKAAALSFDKYCSVSMTMNNCVDITYDVFVNDEKL